MVTSSADRVRKPGLGDVVVKNWQSAGLRRPSVIRTRRLWTAEERDFAGAVLGTVEPALLERVKQTVRSMVT